MALKLSERDIERTCTDWLALDGWRCLKTDPCSDRRRGKGFGEVGMADCLYIRYETILGCGCCVQNLSRINYDVGADVMWVEWKSGKGEVQPHQIAWHFAERARGAVTLIAGADFPTSIEGFQRWYRESGLMRRKI